MVPPHPPMTDPWTHPPAQRFQLPGGPVSDRPTGTRSEGGAEKHNPTPTSRPDRQTLRPARRSLAPVQPTAGDNAVRPYSVRRGPYAAMIGPQLPWLGALLNSGHPERSI